MSEGGGGINAERFVYGVCVPPSHHTAVTVSSVRALRSADAQEFNRGIFDYLIVTDDSVDVGRSRSRKRILGGEGGEGGSESLDSASKARLIVSGDVDMGDAEEEDEEDGQGMGENEGSVVGDASSDGAGDEEPEEEGSGDEEAEREVKKRDGVSDGSPRGCSRAVVLP